MSDLPILSALTIRQPWATAINMWTKSVENRTWATTRRGPIAIHAGGTWDRSAERAHTLTNAFARHGGASQTYIDTVYRDGLDPRDDHMFPRGVILAIADITGMHMCANGACSPWAIAGQWHWELSNVRPLPNPIRVTGRLGLWPLPADINADVHAALNNLELAHAAR